MVGEGLGDSQAALAWLPRVWRMVSVVGEGKREGFEPEGPAALGMRSSPSPPCPDCMEGAFSRSRVRKTGSTPQRKFRDACGGGERDPETVRDLGPHH